MFVIFGFGLGIYYIMKHIPSGEGDCENEVFYQSPFLHQIKRVFMQLDSLIVVLKVLFWNIFDPGSVEDFGCRKEDNPAVPRYVAMAMFALYLVITIIILLNTLIAIMNNSVDTISEKEVKSGHVLVLALRKLLARPFKEFTF